MPNKNLNHTENYSLLIIIPALNEADTIGNIVKYITKLGVEVVVIDDHSTDKTRVISSDAGATVIHTKSDTGYSAAILTGIRYSLKKGVSHVITIDADGAHDTREIENIFKSHLDSGCELTIGDRFSRTPCLEIPSPKIWSNYFAASLVNIALKTNLSDVACGFRVLSSGLCKRLLKQAVSKGYGLAYEMIAITLNTTRAINSFPVSVHYDASCFLCTSQTELIDYLKTMRVLEVVSKTFVRSIDSMIISVECLEPITIKLSRELICLLPVKEYKSYVFQRQHPIFIENIIGKLIDFRNS